MNNLEELPKLTTCEACENQLWYNKKEHLYRCNKCKKTYPYYHKTLLAYSHVKPGQWAEYLNLISKQAYNTKQLTNHLNLNRTSLHKLGNKLRQELEHWLSQQVLEGIIEVDEVFLGWNKEHGRSSRPAILLLCEKQGKRRTLTINLKDTTSKELTKYVKRYLKPGSIVLTDGWKGYNKLSKLGYQHEPVDIQGSEKQAHELLPRVYSEANQLKAFFRTFVRPVSEQYLDQYLAEYSWRASHRNKTPKEKYELLLETCLERRER